ncbi:hypothetical protein, partial [Massilia cavernae]
MNDSFLSIRSVSGKFVVRGQPACALGHRLERSDGAVDGIYANWTWDGSCLTARNDRYGMFPIYYTCRDGEFAISSSIPRLLEAGASCALDEPALSVFFRLGFFIGDDTPFRDIRALPPNTTLRWNGRLQLESGGRALGRTQPPMSRDTALDTYIALFRQSIKRRPPPEPDFTVPLSGG